MDKFHMSIYQDFSTRGNSRPKENRGFRAEFCEYNKEGSLIRIRKRFKNYNDAQNWLNQKYNEKIEKSS